MEPYEVTIKIKEIIKRNPYVSESFVRIDKKALPQKDRLKVIIWVKNADGYDAGNVMEKLTKGKSLEEQIKEVSKEAHMGLDFDIYK